MNTYEETEIFIDEQGKTVNAVERMIAAHGSPVTQIEIGAAIQSVCPDHVSSYGIGSGGTFVMFMKTTANLKMWENELQRLCLSQGFQMELYYIEEEMHSRKRVKR